MKVAKSRFVFNARKYGGKVSSWVNRDGKTHCVAGFTGGATVVRVEWFDGEMDGTCKLHVTNGLLFTAKDLLDNAAVMTNVSQFLQEVIKL